MKLLSVSMKAKLQALLQRPGMRYLSVGGSVYVLELAIIIIAEKNGAGPVLSVALSYTIGTLVSFALQKFVTFGDKRMHHKIVIPQLLATIALVFFNFGFTVLVAQALYGFVPTVVCRTLALLMTTVWNFYLYKTKIFTPSEGVL